MWGEAMAWRSGTLRIIGMTAVVTCTVTLVGVYSLWIVVNRQQPQAPRIRPPKTMTVIMHPFQEWDKTRYPPTEIPAAELDYAFRLVTPDRYYEGGLIERPLMAVVVLSHESWPDTMLLVRWSGHNPALISVDGRNYFYGRNDEDIGDGGLQLLRLVHKLTDAKPP